MQHRLKHATSGRKARFSFPVLAGHEGSRAQRLIRLQSRPPPDDRAGVWLRPSPIRRGIFDVLPCNRGPGMRRHWSSFLFLATAAALLLARSEEHTSELQSLMRISYAVFCLKKKKNTRLR